MGYLALGDDAVSALGAADAVDTMREAVRAAYAGQLAAPARVRAELADLDYVFPVGTLGAGPSGFRAYRAGSPEGDQLVAVWDVTGQLTGVVVGSQLGARRTGALGAVATDALARLDARGVAVIGSGVQAWTQLWATTGVRDIRRVQVFSPDPRHRARFAARAEGELRVQAAAVATAREALTCADIVILATTATRPVIAAEDVQPGAHVSSPDRCR
jgi:ornithine cyclodeaminase/alanine dehydrogenase-like protein (mu-crystallin family)